MCHLYPTATQWSRRINKSLYYLSGHLPYGYSPRQLHHPNRPQQTISSSKNSNPFILQALFQVYIFLCQTHFSSCIPMRDSPFFTLVKHLLPPFHYPLKRLSSVLRLHQTRPLLPGIPPKLKPSQTLHFHPLPSSLATLHNTPGPL